MGKRKKSKQSNAQSAAPQAKRPRHGHDPAAAAGGYDAPAGAKFDAARGYIDPSTGQRGAFPGLDGFAVDEDFYGPPLDGLDYLRMVRCVQVLPRELQPLTGRVLATGPRLRPFPRCCCRLKPLLERLRRAHGLRRHRRRHAHLPRRQRTMWC